MHLRLLIICLLFASCSSTMIQTDLYFGQTRPDGTKISEAEWNNFKQTHIARLFKEGSTTFAVTGNWYDSAAHKLITEPTYMVSHLHKRSALFSRQIDSLTDLYKTMFQQQSVLRVDIKLKKVRF